MRLFVLSLFLLLFSAVAQADIKSGQSGSGFYLGASWLAINYGIDDLEEDLDDAAAVAAIAIDPSFIGQVDIDETDHGWKLYGGYNFNQHIGIEGGYYDLGQVSSDTELIDPSSPIFFRSSSSGDVDAFALFGTARFSQNGFTGFVKAGIARVELDLDDLGVDDDDIVAAVGAGFIWSGKYPLGFRLEIEYFDEAEEIDMRLISLGLQYNFLMN